MLDIFNFILVAVALGVIALSIREYAGTSIGATFVYFLTGTILLGSIRLFYALVEVGVIPIHELTVMYWWHFLFYLAMICFIVAGYALVQLVSPAGSRLSFPRSFAAATVFIVLGVLVFLTAVPMDPTFERLEGTFWDWSGLPHFVAFILGGLLASYFFQTRKNRGSTFSTIATPLLVSLSFLALIHLLELLVDSWRVVRLGESAKDLYEGVLWLGAFITLLLAFARFRMLSRRT